MFGANLAMVGVSWLDMWGLRLSTLLGMATTGLYLLMALGATVAAVNDLSIVSFLHYTAAILLWLFLLGVVLRSWRGACPRRVRMGVAFAVVLYPFQALVGASDIVGIPVIHEQLHLFGAMLIFSILLMSLVWMLDHQTRDRAASQRTDFDPHPDGATTRQRVRAEKPTGTGRVSRRHRVRAYLRLTKPRLMWLLCLLALAGMGLATITGRTLQAGTVFATLGGGVLAIGASGTFNHVYERGRDSQMARTADRPIPQGEISPMRATLFGLVLAVASLVLMLMFVNRLAAALTAVAIGYYCIGYTMLLKPNTVWNIALGGGAGALPAVIGWCAVTGDIGAPAILLAILVVFWTPAHFYNLAIVHRDEYARADIPVLPVVRGIETTRRRILYSLGATMLIAIVLAILAELGPIYGLAIAILGGYFLWSLMRQYDRHTTTRRSAYRSFHASNAYLGVLLVAIVIETVVVPI